MKIKLIFLVIFISPISIQAQIYNTPISQIISASLNNLSFEMIDEDIETTKEFSDFNFDSFEPLEKDSISNFFYKCYYNEGQIHKISMIDTKDNSVNYDFGILHTDSFIYMIARKADSVDRSESVGNNIYGIFLIEKQYKHIYFFGPVYYNSNTDTTINSIRNIFLLNKNLVATKKLIFMSRKLIYQTHYDYSARKVDENMWHYLFHPNIPDKGCNKYQDLGNLTLYDLQKLFNTESVCPCNKLEKAESRKEYLGEHIPFVWNINEYFYKK